MFKKVKLVNYKTHRLTEIYLSPVTLLIGNNSSGKTNLMSGIQYFANLVKRGDSDSDGEDNLVRLEDYLSLKYRFAKKSDPMSMSIIWQRDNYVINYTMELYIDRIDRTISVACRESLSIQTEDNNSPQEITFGFDKPTQKLGLRIDVESSTNLNKNYKVLIRQFFSDLTSTVSYHFQPSYLKRFELNSDVNNGVKISKLLGYEGDKLSAIILHIKEHQESTFSRFMALMRRFQPSFQGVRLAEDSTHDQYLVWEFDLGRTKIEVDTFSSDSVSDGFLKAAALAVLLSLTPPPALILIEEIENGVNPGNIQQIMDWIWKAALASHPVYTMPQFILTSHSPSVLREFHEHLDCVYTTRLQKKGWVSDVRNLSQALDTLIGIGTVEGESTPKAEPGLFEINMPKYQLAELWYSGTIG
jgi:predicted ATPase